MCPRLGFRRSEKDISDVDEIVGDNPKPDKTPHSIVSSVAAATEPVTPLQDADAAFTAGTPFLGFLEPPLFLTLPALRAFGGLAGNRYALHAQCLGRGFIGGGEETRISGGHARGLSE